MLQLKIAMKSMVKSQTSLGHWDIVVLSNITQMAGAVLIFEHLLALKLWIFSAHGRVFNFDG
jgi:hypothetical protein